jgi:hypothetical protein
MKKMRYYEDGGAVGYEEDPKPGIQTDKEDVPKNPFKRDGSRAVKRRPRVMSSDEFLRQYKDSAPSDRIRKEASENVKKDKASDTAPMTRVDMGGVSFGDLDMTREEQESIAKNLLKGVAAIGSAGSVGPVVRGVQTAKRRYDIGRRVDAMTENQQKTAMMRAAREAREVDGMRSGGRVSGSSMGGSVRGGGCEIRGKTKGRMV